MLALRVEDPPALLLLLSVLVLREILGVLGVELALRVMALPPPLELRVEWLLDMLLPPEREAPEEEWEPPDEEREPPDEL